MDTRYHVMFAGELQEGHAIADVRAKMAKLFNANEATLEKLFSGQVQTIKRDCDRPTAAKYKAAIEKAGAKPIIKVAASSTDATSAPPPSQRADNPDEQPSSKPQTAAEKIAALAAAADAQPAYSQPAASGEVAQNTGNDAEAESTQATGAASSGLTGGGSANAPTTQTESDLLAPAGSEVLRPDERQQVAPAEVDTTGLELDAPTDRLAPASAPAPPPPDTSHLDMGEVGEAIPTLATDEPALAPNTDAISLAPEGGDLSDCAPETATAPNLDLSAINLAPTGADVLEEQYRSEEVTDAPDTGHLTLDDSNDLR